VVPVVPCGCSSSGQGVVCCWPWGSFVGDAVLTLSCLEATCHANWHEQGVCCIKQGREEVGGGRLAVQVWCWMEQVVEVLAALCIHGPGCCTVVTILWGRHALLGRQGRIVRLASAQSSRLLLGSVALQARWQTY
jgi:hypothetical protein